MVWPLGMVVTVLGIWCHLVDATRKASPASKVVAWVSPHSAKQLPNTDDHLCFSSFFQTTFRWRKGDLICIVYHDQSHRKSFFSEITDQV